MAADAADVLADRRRRGRHGRLLRRLRPPRRRRTGAGPGQRPGVRHGSQPRGVRGHRAGGAASVRARRHRPRGSRRGRAARRCRASRADGLRGTRFVPSRRRPEAARLRRHRAGRTYAGEHEWGADLQGPSDRSHRLRAARRARRPTPGPGRRPSGRRGARWPWRRTAVGSSESRTRPSS